MTAFFRDQKSRKDDNNVRWALDSFSPAPDTWGTRSWHRRWQQVTQQPQTGSRSSTPKGFLPAEAHLECTAAWALPALCPAEPGLPDPRPGDQAS